MNLCQRLTSQHHQEFSQIITYMLTDTPPPAIDFIVSTVKSSVSVEEFINVLTMHGFAQMEAKFLWDLIDIESEQ